MASQQDLIDQSRLNAAVEAEEFNLVSLLHPKISIDGNQWCLLYGEDAQNGVCGFGETLYLAVLDFNKSWTKRLDQPTKGEER